MPCGISFFILRTNNPVGCGALDAPQTHTSSDEQCSPLQIIHCRDKSRFVRGTFMNVPYARPPCLPCARGGVNRRLTVGLSLIQSVGDTSPLHSYLLLITFSGGPSGTPVPTNSWTNKKDTPEGVFIFTLAVRGRMNCLNRVGRFYGAHSLHNNHSYRNTFPVCKAELQEHHS